MKAEKRMVVVDYYLLCVVLHNILCHAIIILVIEHRGHK